MSYSFEEIMNYHADNREVYQEIKENLSNFVPFIGAGLTQFAYYSWENALKQLANKISNRKNKKLVIEKIRKQEYFAAAQKLEELRGENNLALDIKNLFSSTHLEKKRSELPKQAISLLPLLFPKFVITTNFDETLEILDFPEYDIFNQYTDEQLLLFVKTFLNLQEFYHAYVCITEEIHKLFHKEYGYGDNTEEQWNDFTNKYENGYYKNIA